MHQNNLELFKRHGLPFIRPGDDVLEIGPDWLVPGGMCRPLVEAVPARYHFCNVENNQVGRASSCLRMASPYEVENDDKLFDVVFSLSVAEHVPKIWEWLEMQIELLKPGGTLICVSPTSWPYHESPVDCWRIYPEGYKALYDLFDLELLFSFEGNVVDLEPHLQAEHGPHQVRDCIAIGRKYED